MQQIVAPPELMLAQMTYAGVDHAVLQTGWGYGAMNDYNAFAQSQYPDKFTALLNVDEARAYTPAMLAEFDRAYNELKLRGVYFALDAFARYGFDINFDDQRMEAFWSKVAKAKLTVFFEITSMPHYDKVSYISNVVRLKSLIDSYPDIRWILVMGPPVNHFGATGKWEFPEEVSSVYGHERVSLEVMYPITYGGSWDYPYHEAQTLIQDLCNKYGASKLIWGSDAPNVERFCTYTQSLDYVRRHCTFLNESEKDAILGDNLDEILKISEHQIKRS